MLNCRACLWRCIQALDTTPARPHLRRNVAPALLFGRQRRLQTTWDGNLAVQKSEAPPVHGKSRDILVAGKKDAWRGSLQTAKLKKWEDRSRCEQPARPPRDGKDAPRKFGLRDPSMSMKDWQNRKRELTFLTDPLKLAAYVRQELHKGRATEMLHLVRMASHDMQCVVSWNHLIDQSLAKGNVGMAVKMYNEMKKRAQFPDAYTYSLLLRGLSLNAHMSGAAAKAISIYHSMSGPNSRVEPTIIHTNSVLKVCARAFDMDGLWGVAGKIPDKGPASANAITYATILGAIRMDLIMNAPKGETEEARATRRDQGVVAGRRMWEDIIKKWRNADLIIEEELVGAMGRLLLVGARPRDWDDVLSLVEQTMNIPRKVSSIGSPSRTEAGFPHLRAPVVPEQFRFDDDHLSPSKEPMRGDEFLPITTQDKEDRFSSRRLMYASPGNNTLSMLQDACLKVVAAKAADAYWDLLTDPSTYNIIPDFENLNMRLRVLRQNRSSNDAVKFITEEFLPREKPRPGTFRIAMSTCVRDKNNRNSFRHAGQILEMMRKELEDTDAKTVSMYADLAKDFPNATGVHYQEALVRLAPIGENLRIQLGVGSMNEKEGQPVINRLVGVEREDAITALNRIQALYHKLLDSDSISEKEKLPFKRMRARLSAFLQRAMVIGNPKKAASAREADKIDMERQGEKKDEGEVEGHDEGGEGAKKEVKKVQRKWQKNIKIPRPGILRIVERRKAWNTNT